MLRNIAVVLGVLALGLAVTVDDAVARGGRRGCGSSCGSSCGSGCGRSCGRSCGSSCGAACSTCGVGGCSVHTAAVAGPATIVVSLPADATLTIDGQATTSTSGTRLFNVVGLENGFEYVYTLQADVVRDGRTERISQRVVVRAGQETRVTMDLPTGVASR